MFDLGGDPFGNGGNGFGRPASPSATSWTRSSAAARTRARGRGSAAARTRSSASSSTSPRRRSARPASSRSTPRSAARPARAPAPRRARRSASCATCNGRGEVQQVQRSFLGQVMTSRPCPQCGGFGTIIPHPVQRLRRRRPRPHPPDPDRPHPGRRRHRHPHPADRRGRGRPGQRPAGDLYVEVHRAPAPDLPAARRRPALHAHAADDGCRARRDGPARDPRRRRADRRTPRHPARPGDPALRGTGVTHLRAGGRGDLLVHVDVQTPTKLDARAGGAAARARPATRRGTPGRRVRPRSARACSPGSATPSTAADPVSAPVFFLDGAALAAGDELVLDGAGGTSRGRRTSPAGRRGGRRHRRGRPRSLEPRCVGRPAGRCVLSVRRPVGGARAAAAPRRRPGAAQG